MTCTTQRKSYLQSIGENDIRVHRSNIKVVDKWALRSVGVVMETKELLLNTITHLENRSTRLIDPRVKHVVNSNCVHMYMNNLLCVPQTQL